MSVTSTMNSLRHGSRRAAGVLGLFFGLLTVAACGALDELVDVNAPDRIVGDVLETPENALTLMAGAVGDFECALASYIVATGLTGDELMITDALRAWELYDLRQFETRGLGSAYAMATCSFRFETTVGVYRPLSTARWQADNLLRLLDGWTDEQVPNRKLLIAKASAYAGYSLLLLGESMCEASFDLGPPVGSAEMFRLAEERLTQAITVATEVNSAEFLNMARVGRARTRLSLGRKADAAADARLVPTTFVKNAGYSTTSPRRENDVHVLGLGNIISVDPQFRTVLYQGVADSRVPVTNTGRVVIGVNIPVWTQTKYAARNSTIPIARAAEAQLIVAEAEVDAGNLQAAVTIINALHTRVGLPQFNSTDRAAIMNQILYERRTELFLESHRLGDMKRYRVPLVPPAGSPHHTGGNYGDALCYPYPGIELDNNPRAR